MTNNHKQTKLQIHLTNITGLGATKLLESILPHIDGNQKFKTYEFHIPDKGNLSKYKAISKKTDTVIFKRNLPNAISRFLECLFPNSRYDDGSPILVMGDLPLKLKKGNQVLFLQSSLLVKPWTDIPQLSSLKYIFSKIIFYINLRYVKAIIVQTSVMKEKLLSLYPSLNKKIHIISHPVPSWVKKEDFKSKEKSYSRSSKLSLIYPAAYYSHKNHKILTNISCNGEDWPISKMTLTIDERKNPNPSIDWINCCGQIGHNRLLQEYYIADALIFLSLEESFGFPLLEAMYLDLPILCSDLPFARILCGDNAIYFNPHDISSLRKKILELKEKLISGWTPDWSSQLKKIPKDWKTVADGMIDICV